MSTIARPGQHDDALRRRLRGAVVGPNDADYDEARQAFNLSLDLRPALVAYPQDAADLAEVVRGSGEDLNARMGYRYPPGAVRRLDDALLAAYGERYVALHGNAHRVDLLRARLEKLT